MHTFYLPSAIMGPALAVALFLTGIMTRPALAAAGKAISLDGVDDYVATTNFMSGEVDFSATAWIKTTQTTAASQRYNDPAIFGTRQGAGDSNDWVLTNFNGQLAWYDELLGGANTFDTGVSIANGTWHHVAIVRSGATLRFYVDGTLVGTDTTGTDGVRNDTIEIGRAFWSDEGGSLEFAGQIDEVTVWNRSLSLADIQAIMSLSPAGGEPGLLGYWNFDDETAADLSGNGNAGVASGGLGFVASDAPINGNATLAPFSSVAPTGLPYLVVARDAAIDGAPLPLGAQVGLFDGAVNVGAAVVMPGGNALAVDGSGDYVDVADSNSLDVAGSQITLEAWIFITSFAGDYRCIVGKIDWSDSSAWSYNLHVNDGGGLHFNVANAGGTDFPLNSPYVLGNGVWRHVAGTYDGATLRMYVNGVQVASRSGSGALRQNSYPVRIGAWWASDTNYFNGLIDEVRVWNYARTGSEIGRDFDRELTGGEAGLAGYWRFNGNASDQTPNANHGTPIAGNAAFVGNPAPAASFRPNLGVVAWGADAAQGLSGFTTGHAIGYQLRTNWFSATRIFSAVATNIQGNGLFGTAPFTVADLSVTTGSAPDISSSAALLNFNVVTINASSGKTLTVTNNGNATLRILEIFDNSPNFTVSPASSTLQPSGSQIITVTFTPTAVVDYQAALTIIADDPDEARTVIPLHGTGAPTPLPDISFFPESLHFDNTTVDASTFLPITFTNLGNGALNVTDITSSNPEFTVIGATAFSLDRNENLTVQIAFTPTAVGLHGGQITIDNNDADVTIPVTGIASAGHFGSVEETGLPYQVIVDDVTVDGFPFGVGDEIAVYDGATLVGVGARDTGGEALLLDGSGDYVEVPDHDSLDVRSNRLTLEAWVFVNSFAGDYRCIIGKIGWGDTSLWSYNLHVNDGGGLHFNFVNTSGASFPLNSPAPIGTNAWHHVAATYDGTVVRLYIDGGQVATLAASGAIRQNAYPVRIGAWYSGDPNYFNGQIDEVRIWDIARTQAEIRSTRNRSLSGQEPGLVGYWNFDDGTAGDLSFSQNQATLIGNAHINEGGTGGGITWITAWQKDASLGLSGFTPGHTIAFRLHTTTYGSELELPAAPAYIVGNGTFGFGQFSLVTLQADSGLEPDIAVSPSRLQIGQTPLNQTIQGTIQLANTGNAPLRVLLSEESGPFSLSVTDVTIAGGGNAAVIVTFAPPTAGNHITTVRIRANDPDEPEITVNVEGFGLPIGAPDIRLSQDVVNFGDNKIGTTAYRTFSVINTGTAPLVVSSVTSSSDLYTISPTSFTLVDTNDHREVTIAFAPEAKEVTSAAITVESNAGDRTVAVTGMGFDGHFSVVNPTGLPYQVVIRHIDLSEFLRVGDEIGVFDGAQAVGVAVVQSMGASLSLDGNGDYMQITSAASLHPAQITVEAWVRTVDAGASEAIVSKTNGCASSGYLLWLNENGIGAGRPSFWVGGGPWLDADVSIHDGGWHHVAGTFDGATSRIYVDGVLRNSGSRSANLSSSNPLQIGGSTYCGSPLDGEIDDVRIWNHARNQTQIQSMRAQKLAGNETGLIGYWPFDGDTQDQSPSANHGFLVDDANLTGDQAFLHNDVLAATVWKGAPGVPGFIDGHTMSFKLWTTVNDFPVELDATPIMVQGNGTFGHGVFSVVDLQVKTPDINVAPAQLFVPLAEPNATQRTITVTNAGDESLAFEIDIASGQALQLHGGGDILDTSYTGPLSTWTLMAWVKDDGTRNGWRAIIQTNVSDDSALYINPNGVLEFWPAGSSSGTVPDNVWTHVAASSADNGPVNYYVNGVPMGTSSAGTPDIDFIRLGGHSASDSELFVGLIDEVRVFDRVLTATEVQAVMGKTALGNETGIVAAYNFDNGSPTDLSGNGYHGSFVGAAEIVPLNAPVTTWLSTVTTGGALGPSQLANVILDLASAGLVDGMYHGTVIFTSNTPHESPVYVPVTLNVTGAAQISTVIQALDFGTVIVGQTKSLTCAVTNIGTDVLTISSATVADTVGFSVAAATFPILLDPLESHSFTIRFTPTSDASVTDVLTIASDAANDPTLEIPLTGDGVTPPDIDVSPASWTGTLFSGNVTQEIVTVENDGQAALNFTIGESIPWLSVNRTGGQLAIGESLTVTASISSVGLFAGPYTGILHFLSDDPDEPDVAFQFNLTVTGEPRISAPATIAFGNVDVGEVSNRNLQINNTGTDVLTIQAISISGSVFTRAATPTTPFTIAPGTFATIGLTFTPVGSATDSETLTISSNAVNAVGLPVTLTGTGIVPPVIAVTPTSFVETLTSGTSVNRSLSIENQGGNPLNFQIELAPAGQTALTLDGNGDFISVPDDASLNPGSALTIEGWLYLGDTNDEFIVAKEATAEGTYRLWVNSQGKFQFRLNGNRSVISATSAVAGAWRHVAVTFDGATMRIYINGVLDAAETFAAFTIDANALNLRVGRSFDNRFFTGRMEELRVWTVARNPSEIQALMSQSLRGTETGLVLYYRFDETTGTIARDLSRAANDGTYFGNAARVASDAPINDFLDVTPLTGTVAGGATQPVTVRFDSTGLISNLYRQTLTVLANDPDHPETTIPVTMTVVGQGQIAVSPATLTFSDTFVGITNSLPLTIMNTGSETVEIFQWQFSTDVYAVSAEVAEISPFSSQRVNIFFTPASAGAAAALLTIANNSANDASVEVALSGNGIEPPTIQLTPTSFAVELDAGATTSRPLTVANIGGSDLNYALIADAARTGGQALTINTGFGRVPNPTLYNRQTMTIECWAKPIESHTVEGGAVWSRVEQDGTIIAALRVWSGTTSSLQQSGYEVVTNGGRSGAVPYDFTANEWAHLAVILTSSETRLLVNGSLVLTMAKEALNLTNSGDFRVGNDGVGNLFHGEVDELRIWDHARGLSELSSLRNQSVVGTEAGLLGYFAFDSLAGGTTVADLSGNSNAMTITAGAGLVASTAPLGQGTNSGVPWLSISSASGTIAPSGSNVITLGFNAQTLGFGTYNNDLTVSSNDLFAGVIRVPLTLSVNAPRLSVPATVAFGNVGIGVGATRSVSIANTGNRPLEITTYSVSPSVFSLPDGVTSFSVPVGESRTITVRLDPANEGAVTGSLTINSNAGSSVVPLSGVGFHPRPEIDVSPTSFVIDVNEGAVVEETLTVSNLGQAVLTVSISTGLAWVTVTPSTQDIPPAARELHNFTVRINATGILPGDYGTNIVIANNDLDENPVTVPASIHVGPEPELRLPVTVVNANAGVGQQIARSFAVENIGAGTLGLSVSESEPWIESVAFPATIAGNGAGTVTFDVNTNTLVGGNYTAVFSITSNGGNATYTLHLAVLAPVIAVPVTTLSATVITGATTTRTLTVINQGLAPLEIAVTGLQSVSWLTVATPNLTIPAGTNGVLTFTFHATSLAPGSFSHSFSITHNDPVAATVVINASLVVVEESSILSVTLDSAIGYVPGATVAATQRFSTQATSQAVTVDTQIVDAGQAVRATSTAARTLTLGSANQFTATVVVPESLTSGTYTLRTVLKDGSGGAVHDTFDTSFLVGTPVILIDPAPAAFGSVALGSSRSISLTIANQGDLTMTFSFANVTAPVSVAPSSGQVAPSQSTQVTLTLTATATGAFARTLTVVTNGADAQLEVTANVGEANIEVGQPYIFETLDPDAVSSRPLTITNSGAATLTYNLSGIPVGANWVSLSKTTGAVLPGNNDVVQVNFQTNANRVSYAADVIIQSNDQQTPQLTVPVSLDTEDVGGSCN